MRLEPTTKGKQRVSIVIPQKCFHAFRITFFSFWIFYCGLSGAFVYPDVFTVPSYCSLCPDCPARPPCHQAHTSILSLSHSVTDAFQGALFLPTVLSFPEFQIGFFFCPPHQPHICCYCLYLIQLFVFSVESLSSCSVA